MKVREDTRAMHETALNKVMKGSLIMETFVKLWFDERMSCLQFLQQTFSYWSAHPPQPSPIPWRSSLVDYLTYGKSDT